MEGHNWWHSHVIGRSSRAIILTVKFAGYYISADVWTFVPHKNLQSKTYRHKYQDFLKTADTTGYSCMNKILWCYCMLSSQDNHLCPWHTRRRLCHTMGQSMPWCHTPYSPLTCCMRDSGMSHYSCIPIFRQHTLFAQCTIMIFLSEINWVVRDNKEFNTFTLKFYYQAPLFIDAENKVFQMRTSMIICVSHKHLSNY